MADRHKRHPRAVRMPDGLEAWFVGFAAETGQHVNKAIVTALEAFRLAHDGATADGATATDGGPVGATTDVLPRKRARKPRAASPAPVAEPSPRPRATAKSGCTHRGPKGSYCSTCGCIRG